MERREAGQQMPARVLRPWGDYQSLDVGNTYQVKRITVKPGAKLSIQKHRHRAEHWTVVEGVGRVLREEILPALRAHGIGLTDERGLDEMSNGPRTWPQGNTAYLYGSSFFKYIFDRFGEHKLAEMSYNFGSSPIPYGLNRSISRATGHGFTELHEGWLSHRRERYAMEEEAVLRRGRREGRRLTFTGQANLNPRYSRDGKNIIWQHGPGDRQGRYAARKCGF